MFSDTDVPAPKTGHMQFPDIQYLLQIAQPTANEPMSFRNAHIICHGSP